MSLEGWLIAAPDDPGADALVLEEQDTDFHTVFDYGAVRSADLAAGEIMGSKSLDPDMVFKDACTAAREHLDIYFKAYDDALANFRDNATNKDAEQSKNQTFLKTLRDKTLTALWKQLTQVVPVLTGMFEGGAELLPIVTKALGALPTVRADMVTFISTTRDELGRCAQQSKIYFGPINSEANAAMRAHHEGLEGEDARQSYLRTLLKQGESLAKKRIDAQELELDLYRIWSQINEGHTAPGTGQDYTGTLDLTFEIPERSTWNDLFGSVAVERIVFKQGALRMPGATGIVKRLAQIASNDLCVVRMRFAITVKHGDPTVAFSVYSGDLSPDKPMLYNNKYLHESEAWETITGSASTGLQEGLSAFFQIDWSKITGTEDRPV